MRCETSAPQTSSQTEQRQRRAAPHAPPALHDGQGTPAPLSFGSWKRNSFALNSKASEAHVKGQLTGLRAAACREELL